MGDEPLGAAQDVAVAVAVGPAPEGGRVGAARGLGERVGAQPRPREQASEVALLQLLRPVVVDAERRQVVDRHPERQGEEPGSELFEHREVGERRLPAAAESLLVRDAAQAHLAQLLEELPGELVALLEPARGRHRLRRDELAHGQDHVPLVLGEPEVTVHGAGA